MSLYKINFLLVKFQVNLALYMPNTVSCPLVIASADRDRQLNT